MDSHAISCTSSIGNIAFSCFVLIIEGIVSNILFGPIRSVYLGFALFFTVGIFSTILSCMLMFYKDCDN
jgi:hypothetical protein